MRELIIFGLLAIISPVQSTGIIKSLILEEGAPFTYVGEKPSASWYIPGKMLVVCEGCPSSPCTVHKDYKDKIDVSCQETNPTIRFNSIPIETDGSVITSPVSGLDYTVLRVGRYDGRLHAEKDSPVAMKDKSFTLVCDKSRGGDNYWFTDEFSGTMYDFHIGCKEGLYNYDKSRFDFTCDETSSRLHIKKVTPSDDGKVFGCSEELYGVSSLFKLSVN